MDKNTTTVFGQAAKTMIYLEQNKKNKSSIQHTQFPYIQSTFLRNNYQVIDNIYSSSSQKSSPDEKNQVSHCTYIFWLLGFKTQFFKAKLHLWTSHTVHTSLLVKEIWLQEVRAYFSYSLKYSSATTQYCEKKLQSKCRFTN